VRLALLSPLPPEQTGIADYAEHLRRALAAIGMEVLTPLLGQPPLRDLASAKRWVAGQDWRGVDVVHAEMGGGRLSEFLALSALASMPQRPALSATVHDPERLVWRPVHPWWQTIEQSKYLPRVARQALAVLMDPHTLRAERRLAAQLDGLVALTDTGARCLASRMGVPLSKVSTIAHGTLSLPAAPLPPLAPIKLLYFGFIYSGKGIEDLIDAVGRVLAEHPTWRDRLSVTIAGGTAPDVTYGNETSYLDGLRARVAQCGLNGLVNWALDVSTDDIAALVQAHHVMVLPYRESRKLALLGQMRGTSGALAWAMAAGRGVITSDARAFAEEVSTGNGVSYPQGDVDALAGHLVRLIEQPTLAQAWAERAQQLGQARAWPVTAPRFEAHFRQAIQAAAKRGRA
jgi:glycosyltransferase involved in cell wall biosynthesis